MQDKNVTRVGRKGRGSHRDHREHNGLSVIEILLLVLLATALSFAVYRAVSPRAHAYSTTTTIRVQPSQTLWQIASENRAPGATTAETVELIKDLNEMTDSSLRVGQTVAVPAATSAMTAVAAR